MTVDYFVLDGDPGSGVVPRRPSVDDLGGAAWEDDQQYPPNPLTDPSADALNQQAKCLRVATQMMPTLKLAVHFVGGVPTIDYAIVAGPNALDPFTDLVFLDNADGDTSVTWPAASMAVANFPPDGLTIYEDTAVDFIRLYRIAHGIRVVTTAAGVATDAAWAVCINGDW